MVKVGSGLVAFQVNCNGVCVDFRCSCWFRVF